MPSAFDPTCRTSQQPDAQLVLELLDLLRQLQLSHAVQRPSEVALLGDRRSSAATLGRQELAPQLSTEQGALSF